MKEKMNKVLVVVDLQNDFLTGSLEGEHCRRAVPGCVRLLKENKWDKVYLTLDTHDKDYLETLEGKKLPVVHCVKHTQGHKLCPEIRNAVHALKNLGEIPTDEDMFEEVEKGTFGSLNIASSLDYVSKGNGGDLEIHICGVCTSICVLANAVLFRAWMPNAKIVVHADACGDVTEEMHRHALECMKAQQCDVVGESVESDDERIGPEAPYCRDENGELVPAEPLKAKMD